MIDISKGRYWDEGIQLIDGCTPCSPGCAHCWSAAMRHRLYGRKRFLEGKLTDEKGHFSGLLIERPERLKRFNTRKPKVFAICNDLYHESVPDRFIGKTFSAMLGYPRNQFLVLTKRPQRMADIVNQFYKEVDEKSLRRAINVWHGLTVVNQQEADEKIPIFLKVPGKKFLSIEPMLEKIDLSHYLWFDGTNEEWFDSYSGGYKGKPEPCYDPQAPFDAVILGGETGPGARPTHPDWVRSIRDQCQNSDVPFFFKGWGKYWKTLPGINPDPAAGRLLDGRTHDDLPWVNSFGQDARLFRGDR